MSLNLFIFTVVFLSYKKTGWCQPGLLS